MPKSGTDLQGVPHVFRRIHQQFHTSGDSIEQVALGARIQPIPSTPRQQCQRVRVRLRLLDPAQIHSLSETLDGKGSCAETLQKNSMMGAHDLCINKEKRVGIR
jgi:hypothetical protein